MIQYQSTILAKVKEIRKILRRDNRGKDKKIDIPWYISSLFMISEFEKIILSYIIQTSNSYGVCFLPDSHFIDYFGISRGALLRKMSFLKRAGFIETDKEFGCRIIKVNLSDIMAVIEELGIKKENVNIHEKSTETEKDYNFKNPSEWKRYFMHEVEKMEKDEAC